MTDYINPFAWKAQATSGRVVWSPENGLRFSGAHKLSLLVATLATGIHSEFPD